MSGTKTAQKTWIAAALCAAGLIAASCGASPTSPSAGAPVVGIPFTEAASPLGAPTPPEAFIPAGAIASAAGADATRLNFSVDLTVPAYPVCPLTPPAAGELHGDGVLTVVLRSVADAIGGTRLGSSIHGHGTATDATGARWVWSDADLNNELFPSGNTAPNSFTQTVHEGFHVIGPKGQHIMVIGTFHVTTANGVTTVEVEQGNHEEGEICESGFALTPLP